MLSQLKGGGAVRHVFYQKATPHGIHIRNQHQILSNVIMDILEYLISKKNFLVIDPSLVDCVGPK